MFRTEGGTSPLPPSETLATIRARAKPTRQGASLGPWGGPSVAGERDGIAPCGPARLKGRLLRVWLLRAGVALLAGFAASSAVLAQQTGGPVVQPAPVALPSASIASEEELTAMIEAPAPKVDAERSTHVVEGGGVLPELLTAVAAERAALARRAEALDLREAEIAFAAAALAEQSGQLGQLKTEIERLLALADDNHHADVARLVKIYRAMKPGEAAQILSTADLEVTVLVLAAMTERDSGPILARMNQVRAQAVSKIILQRSRLPGDQRLISVKVN